MQATQTIRYQQDDFLAQYLNSQQNPDGSTATTMDISQITDPNILNAILQSQNQGQGNQTIVVYMPEGANNQPPQT